MYGKLSIDEPLYLFIYKMNILLLEWSKVIAVKDSNEWQGPCTPYLIPAKNKQTQITQKALTPFQPLS